MYYDNKKKILKKYPSINKIIINGKGNFDKYIDKFKDLNVDIKFVYTSSGACRSFKEEKHLTPTKKTQFWKEAIGQ